MLNVGVPIQGNVAVLFCGTLQQIVDAHFDTELMPMTGKDAMEAEWYVPAVLDCRNRNFPLRSGTVGHNPESFGKAGGILPRRLRDE